MTFLILTLIAVVIFLLFLAMLIWSLQTGQMDDLDSPSEKILWEDIKDG